MKIIRPYAITDDRLIGSSVPEGTQPIYDSGTSYDLYDRVHIIDGFVIHVYESVANANSGHDPETSPLWWTYVGDTWPVYDAGTTYAEGAVVISIASHHEYESLIAGNIGLALDDPTKWLDRGFNNRWRMFDQLNTSQTVRPDWIEAVIEVTGRIDSVALLNIVGARVFVTMTTDADGEVFSGEYPLVSDSGVDSWFDWFFEPIVRKGDFILTDLPMYGNPTISIGMTEPGGDAAIGTMIVGQKRDFGDLLHGARIGIQDYSRKVADDFGNYTIVQRAFSKRASFKVAVDHDQVDALSEILAGYRASPVVWVGTDSYRSTWIYGFYRDWGTDIDYPTVSYLSLEIEGLT